MVQGRIKPAHNRFHYKGHQQSHEQQPRQRIDQNRSNLFQKFRQLIANLTKQDNDVTCRKSCRQGSKEAGLSARCNHTAYKAESKRRSVADRHSNKSCQYRKHKSKCSISQTLQPRRHRSDRTKICPLRHIQGIHIHAYPIDQKRDGNQNTAANYKGKHMGHAVHQLRIDLVSRPAAFLCSLRRHIAPGYRMIYRNIAGNCPIQQFPGFTDSVGHLTFDNFFPIKPIHRNLCVRRNDNTGSFLDFLGRQYIFRTAGTSRFNLYGTIPFFCRLLNSLCRHVGVGNTGGAGCHR